MITEEELERLKNELNLSTQKTALEHALLISRQEIHELELSLKRRHSEKVKQQLLERKHSLDHFAQELQYIIFEAIQLENFTNSCFYLLYRKLEGNIIEKEEEDEQVELQNEEEAKRLEQEKKMNETNPQFSLFERARELRLTPYR